MKLNSENLIVQHDTDCIFPNYGNFFDLKDVVNEFLDNYNERVHSTTWYTLREITERIKDSEFI